jgi:hypothetical protein
MWCRILAMGLCLGIVVMSAPITTHLELVVTQDDARVNGRTPVVVQLVSPTQTVLWEEAHDVMFINGRGAFEIGGQTPLQPQWFRDPSVRLQVVMANDPMVIPLTAVPFSLFSHGADVVNSVHMSGVFHSDLVNHRIGIAIDHPTPSVRLEIGGALRVGNGTQSSVPGTLRWQNNRLEGRHNNAWRRLDVSESDGYISKWSDNNDSEDPAIYIENTSIQMGTTNARAQLTVDGDMLVGDTLTVQGGITVGDDIYFTGEYGVSKNGRVSVASLTLDTHNQLNADGLRVSGGLTGRGDGVTGIPARAIQESSIQSNELADGAITSSAVAIQAVGSGTVSPGAIQRSHLSSGFQLTSSHFAPGRILGAHIQPQSITATQLADDFKLSVHIFNPNAIVSRNIGVQSVISSKIDALTAEDYATPLLNRPNALQDQSILTRHFRDATVLATDFQAGALTFSHLNATLPLTNGGTGSTQFDAPHGLMVVSGNRLVSVPTLVMTHTGLGVHQATPGTGLDILSPSPHDALSIESRGAKMAGIGFKNDISSWHMGVDNEGHFRIEDRLQSNVIFRMGGNGHVGINTPPGVESLTINGAMVLGDALDEPLPKGTLYFSTSNNQLKGWGETGEVSISMATDTGAFYVKNMADHSTQSRILMGQKVQLNGTQHHVLGAHDVQVTGRNHRLNFAHQTQVAGEGAQVVMTTQSQVNATNSQAHWVSSSQVTGHSVVLNQVSNAQVVGDKISLWHTRGTHVNGRDHQVQHAQGLDITGQGHRAGFSLGARLSGTTHDLFFGRHTQVMGNDHRVSHVVDSVVMGNDHSVAMGTGVNVHGQGNYVAFSGATVVGNHQWIDHGNGTYLGDNNQHMGGGEPRVTGANNRLIGHQSGTLNGHHVMAMGTHVSHSISTSNALVFYAPGGVDIMNAGHVVAHLSANGGSWASVSDRSIKTHRRSVDSRDILTKVSTLPIYEWQYKGQPYVTHIGPMAQDVYAQFGLGGSDTLIQTVDMDGIIFGAIQGLGQWYREQRTQQDEQRHRQKQRQRQWAVLSHVPSDWALTVGQLTTTDRALTQRYEQNHQREQAQATALDALDHHIRALKKSWEAAQ